MDALWCVCSDAFEVTKQPSLGWRGDRHGRTIGSAAELQSYLEPEGGANPEAEALFVSDRRAYGAKIQELVLAQFKRDSEEMGALSGVP